MRRILATTIVLAAIGAFALLAGGATEQESGKTQYWIQLDNAFGLTEGSDFKISGVRAGAIGPMKVDRRAGNKAWCRSRADVPGAPKLKTDVTCETRPQSLIGEYFIDCNPGRNPTELKAGSTIPVERTFSTIPADLVNNILRLPQRERLRIILNEFGAGVAARGTDLNAVIRRAVPALRETDKLLDLLADENQTLDPADHQRRRRGGRAGGQPQRRRQLRPRGARHRGGLRRPAHRAGRHLPPAARLPAHAAAQHGGAGPGGRLADADAARPRCRLGQPEGVPGHAGPVLAGLATLDLQPGRDLERRSSGDRRR